MASLRFIPSLIPVYNQTLPITYGLELPADDVEYINMNKRITISVFDPFNALVSLQEHIDISSTKPLIIDVRIAYK